MAFKMLTSLVKRASSSCSSRTPSLLISEGETTRYLGGTEDKVGQFPEGPAGEGIWADVRSVLEDK